MTRIDVPEPARSRLRGLGAPAPPEPPGLPDPRYPPDPPSPPDPPYPPDPRAWGPPRDVDVEPASRPRSTAWVGWPTAAPGTPAARLRLPAEPPRSDDTRRGPDRWGSGPDDDDHEDPDGDGWESPSRRSAWEPVATRAEAWGGHWSERWLPASWREARWDPGRAGALGLAVVTALAALVAAFGVWSDRPVAEPVPALPAVTAAAPAVPGAAPPGGAPAAPVAHDGPIVVSVTGRVDRPGMVDLPAGARVGDALDAAGGALEGTDLTGLNLAQRLADGEQVVVGMPLPAPGAPVPGGGVVTAGGAGSGGAGSGGAPTPPGAEGGDAGSGGGAAGGDLVDLNAATLEDLDALPGVGPVTAQKILDWRQENGRFAAIEQLQDVSGIGEARFSQMKGKVRV